MVHQKWYAYRNLIGSAIVRDKNDKYSVTDTDKKRPQQGQTDHKCNWAKSHYPYAFVVQILVDAGIFRWQIQVTPWGMSMIDAVVIIGSGNFPVLASVNGLSWHTNIIPK